MSFFRNPFLMTLMITAGWRETKSWHLSALNQESNQHVWTGSTWWKPLQRELGTWRVRNRRRIRKQSRNTWHLSKCSRLEEFKLVHQKSSSHVERKNYAIKKSVSHKKRATKSIFKGFCCPFYASRFQVTAISIEYCISGKLARSLSPVCQKHFCGVNFSWKQIVKCRSFEIRLPQQRTL